MKVAIITDTHFGARNDNQAVARFFQRFYQEVFFPELDRRGIKRVLHLGDIVDRRKYINYVTARRLREDFMLPCIERGIEVDALIGNHDTYFKNTNEVNSMAELYWGTDGSKFRYYSDPTEIDIDGTKILMMPWICSGNFEECFAAIENTDAQILFGHLEIAGFEMYRGAIVDHGFDRNRFSKFDVVASGHFHHRSTQGNIQYLGAPYEMTWSDFNDPKGFHIFDTDTREFEFIENPLRLFHKVHFDGENVDKKFVQNFDPSPLVGAYVKVIVRNKVNPYLFDLFIDKIEKAGVTHLQIVDDHFNMQIEDDADIVNMAEDTLSILHKYVEQLDVPVDKQRLESVLRGLYNEAANME